MFTKLFKKIQNRKLARKEHESIKYCYDLNFNQELQTRLDYKKSLLKNQLIEDFQLDMNDSIDICKLENIIRKKQSAGEIDFFYNIIL